VFGESCRFQSSTLFLSDGRKLTNIKAVSTKETLRGRALAADLNDMLRHHIGQGT
jgi:hypothetical protein